MGENNYKESTVTIAPVTPKKKEDLRITKTKNALYNAFLALMAQKTFNDITVNELCDKAGVRRATFYKHFSDKYDFLTQVVKMLRDEFDENIWGSMCADIGPEYYVEYIKALIGFLSSHEQVVNMIFKSEARDSLINLIVEQNFKDTDQRLCDLKEKGSTFKVDHDILACFMAGGVSRAICRWYESGRKTSAEELTEQMTEVIVKLMELCRL